MYTLTDIYNQLSTGTVGTKRTTTFGEPASGPTSATGQTLNAIQTMLPALDAAQGAVAADVFPGKTFWGLTSGAWGLQTGSMSSNNFSGLSCGASNTTPTSGYYTGTLTGDADLVTANIVGGVNIFGVSGKSEVVDTYTTIAATAGDIVSGKVAFANGLTVTGSMSSNNFSGLSCGASN
ncbi:phage-like putative tail protein, partial [Candidatus Magnetobacterium bavaricum]